MKYFLSLGSNLGDKEKNLALALFLLEKEEVEVLKISSLYKTQPLDFKENSMSLALAAAPSSKLLGAPPPPPSDKRL